MVDHSISSAHSKTNTGANPLEAFTQTNSLAYSHTDSKANARTNANSYTITDRGLVLYFHNP